MFTEEDIRNYVDNQISELDTKIRNESRLEFKKYLICRINELAKLREYFGWDESKEDDIDLREFFKEWDEP